MPVSLSCQYRRKSLSGKVGMTGFEPATSASRTHEAQVPSEALSEVTTTADEVSAAVSPKKPKSCSESTSEDSLDLVASPKGVQLGDADFLSAVTAIIALPLTDSEKADSVRRLLAGR